MTGNDLPRLLGKIEGQLDWGAVKTWQIKDSERLNSLIFEQAKVSLSTSTLRRIWGKVNYNYSPTVTTLEALSQFAGNENWRSYCREHKEEVSEKPLAASRVTVKPKFISSILLRVLALLAVVLIIIFSLKAAHIPYKLEDKLIELGADFSSATVPFLSHVETDGLLITGQNPLPAGPAAKALIQVLNGIQ